MICVLLDQGLRETAGLAQIGLVKVAVHRVGQLTCEANEEGRFPYSSVSCGSLLASDCMCALPRTCDDKLENIVPSYACHDLERG